MSIRHTTPDCTVTLFVSTCAAALGRQPLAASVNVLPTWSVTVTTTSGDLATIAPVNTYRYIAEPTTNSVGSLSNTVLYIAKPMTLGDVNTNMGVTIVFCAYGLTGMAVSRSSVPCSSAPRNTTSAPTRLGPMDGTHGAMSSMT